MIDLKNIHVTFNPRTPLEIHVLKGLNLVIETGEFVTVIGGNGAGKSTLMNIISGDVAVDRGSIRLDGCDVTNQSTVSRSTFVSRVFQDPMLGTCASLTIEENLAIGMRRGLSRPCTLALDAKNKKYFHDVLGDLGIGLEKRMQDPMGSLSGGQRQAVSLLMATLRPSKILLLDEHTAALDPKMARVVMNLTQRLITEHKLTAMMITHSMAHALEYGNRTILMYHGTIAKDLHGNERQQLDTKALLTFFD